MTKRLRQADWTSSKINEAIEPILGVQVEPRWVLIPRGPGLLASLLGGPASLQPPDPPELRYAPIVRRVLRPGREADRGRRLEAARRLATHVGNPVHRARRQAVRAALAQGAPVPGRSKTQEYADRVVTAAFEALPEIRLFRFLGFGDFVANEREIRAKLNNSVTEDYLGPEFRRAADLWNRVPDRLGNDDAAAIVAALDASSRDDDRVRELIVTATLSPRESQAFLAVYAADEDETLADLARKGGMTVPSFKTHLRRARQKILKVQAAL